MSLDCERVNGLNSNLLGLLLHLETTPLGSTEKCSLKASELE